MRGRTVGSFMLAPLAILGILLPLATGIPAIRRQESAAAEPAVPRT